MFRRPPSRKAIDALENAPGPSPWSLRRPGARIPRFEWIDAGQSSHTAGLMVLSGARGNLLILDFHNYVLLLDPDTLLVWHQRSVPTGPTAPVCLRGFRLSDLEPLEGDLEDLGASMRQARTPFTASGDPLCEHDIPTTVVCQRITQRFPELLSRCQELLILCHSSGVEDSTVADSSNLALLVARPSDRSYELFPQDWFNHAGLDYAFQGVTRVARDSATGRIHGEGVRIDPFVLDDTLRNTR
jgi:hypothetical protein